jgi:hypothetical protein
MRTKKNKLEKYLPLNFMTGFIMATLFWQPDNKYLPIGFIVLALLTILKYGFKDNKQEKP